MTVISVITKQVKKQRQKGVHACKKYRGNRTNWDQQISWVFFARKPIPLERYASPLQTNI